MRTFSSLLHIKGIGSIIAVLSLVLLTPLTACQTAVSIPFMSVSHEQSLRDYRQPTGITEFLVFMTLNDAERFIAQELHINPTFPDQQFHFAQRVRTVDFSQSFAVLVLQGHQESADYGVTTTHVSQFGGILRVDATFVDPTQPDTWWEYIVGPNTIRHPMTTDPYHLISVSRSALPAPVTKIELWSRGQLITTILQPIP
ncbi:MAG: hypothetical protein MUD01_25140 [Chloroflexaceae bacterium]|jgi:hypothetical protein|nr:hypothetical protein [Chloroflexaceae bacterium]